MGGTRPPYTAEFRHELVEMRRGGRPIQRLSRELDSSTSLRHPFTPGFFGTRRTAIPGAGDNVLRSNEREELARLRCEKPAFAGYGLGSLARATSTRSSTS